MFKDAFHKIIQVLAAGVDIFADDTEGEYVDCANLVGLKFILACSAGAVGTATVTLQKDADGSGAGTAIPFWYRKISSTGVAGAMTQATVAGFTTAAEAEKTYEIFVNLDELGDFRYVRPVFTEAVDAAVEGMCLADLQARTN